MNKSLITAVCVAATSLVNAAVYVTVDGAGDKTGADWSNAYDCASMQAALDAAAVAGTDKVVYLAGGLYYPAQNLSVSNGVSVIGSADAGNPTILCGDTNQDDVWDKFSFDDYYTAKIVNNNLSYTRIETAEPVIKDGALNYPDFGDNVMFFARTEKRTDNKWRCMQITGTSTRTIENLVITGYGRGNADSGIKGFNNDDLKNGCAVYVHQAGTTFKNVKVIGNHVGEGGIQTRGVSTFQNCEFSRNGVSARGSYESLAQDKLYNCRFVSNYKLDGSGGPSIYFWGTSSAVVSNCWFELNECGGGSYSPSPCISVENAAGTVIQDCTFTNNLSINSTPCCINVGAANKWQILNCHFTGNRQINVGVAGITAATCVYAVGGGTALDGCRFVNNRSSFRSTGSAAKLHVFAPYLVMTSGPTAMTAARGEAVNCLFHGNTNELVGTDSGSDTLYLSRGIAAYALSTEANASIGIANCTFAGTTTFPDVIVCGNRSGNDSSVILNSVFSGPALVGWQPLSVGGNQPVVFKKNTTAGVFTYPSSVTVAGVTTDDPLVKLPSGKMSARTDNMRSTYPVAWFLNNSRYFVYADGPATNHLNMGYTAAIPASLNANVDLDRAARPTDGTALRGAVETTDEEMDEKHTVIYRVSPAGAATLDGLTGYTELVAEGADGRTFTIVPASGSIAFDSWQTTNGTVLSTTPSWKPTGITSNVTVVAVFTTPKIKYIFTLGDAGTFIENSSATITNEYTTGDVPSIPAYDFDDEHYVDYGWDTVIPDLVGTEDITFALTYYERKYRIIRFDMNVAGGTGDGSTWANAMTNLQDAIDQAKISGGEVRIKQGVHHPCRTKTETFVSASGVSILGGFDGGSYASDDEELAARDPAANLTILSGDPNNDDRWTGMKLDGTQWVAIYDDGGQYLKVVNTNGTFNAVNPDLTHRYWSANNNTGDNAATLFKMDDASLEVDDTCIFDGLTVVGFTSDNLVLGSHVHPTIRNCSFYGAGTKINCTSWATIENCRFIAGGYAIYTSSTGPWTQRAMMTGCLIEGIATGYRGPLAMQGGSADIVRCTFRRNWSIGTGYGDSATIGAENGSAYVRDSLFEENWSKNGGPVVRTRTFSNAVVRCNHNHIGGTTGSPIILYPGFTDIKIADCTFVSNEVAVASTAASGNVPASIVNLTTHRQMMVNCTFADNIVTGSTAGATSAFGTVVLQNNLYGGALDCTFRNNKVKDGEIVECARSDTRRFYMVNDILWNDASDYMPYKVAAAPTSSAKTEVYNCTIRNYDDTVSTIVVSKDNLTTDPCFRRKAVWGEDGKLALPFSNPTSARSGRDIYVGANGVYLFNSANKGETAVWVYAFNSDTMYTAPLTLIPDIAGSSRPEGKSSRGSMQTDFPNFIMYVR